MIGSPDIIRLIDVYGYVVVSLGIGIESIGIPFPGETTLIAAAIYAGAGHLSIIGVIISSSIGAILGDNIGFTIGKYGGHQLLRKFGKYIRVYPKHLEHVEEYFRKHGGKTVFWGRFIAVLRMWAALLAGANRMQWKTFLIYNGAGGIVWSIFYGFLGYLLGKNLLVLVSILHALSILGLLIFAGIIIAVVLAWKKIMQQIEG